jgi:TRAP-type mannitol/chloroaromatic compound transport system permease small subunit
MTSEAGSVGVGYGARGQGPGALLSRCFAWCTVAAMSAFLLNNYLTNWRNWPGPTRVFGTGGGVESWLQAALFLVFVLIALAFVLRTTGEALRTDALRFYRISAFIVRAAFWAVLLIGLADMVVSFLRVEGMLPGLLGEKLAFDLGRSQFRGVWVHFPMIAIAIVVASFSRGFGFHWLALLVAGAELLIVLSRFIFSYEQAFMGDLVRFWYGALFLFASAHTLIEEGHVRVDVLYSLFTDRARGVSNAIGTVVLGMPLCWVILTLGMGSRSTVINSPLLNFEVTQTGFGMYVRYWMAGFLGIFAITMLIQFSGYFLEAVADIRGDPGKRTPDETASQAA